MDEAQHWTEFFTLLNAGIQGAREASTRRDPIAVMVHIDRGGDNGGSRWFFDHLTAAGVDFDVIGQSYYPFWHGSLADLQANLNDCTRRGTWKLTSSSSRRPIPDAGQR